MEVANRWAADFGNSAHAYLILTLLRHSLMLKTLHLPPQRPPHRLANPIHIQSQFREQLRAFGVLDEPIRDAEPQHVAGAEAGAVGCFKQGAAEAAFEGAFFDGDDQRQLFDGAEQRLLVERLGKASVDDADADAFLTELLGRLDAGGEQAAVGDEDTVGVPFVDLGLAQLDWGEAAVYLFEAGLGVTHRYRARLCQGEAKHRSDVHLVAG